MPDMGIMEVAALVSAITAATGAGLAVEQAATKPDPQRAIDAQQNLQNTLAAQQKAAQQKAQIAGIGQQMPGLQASTGGATSPEYNAGVAGSGGGVGDPNVIQQAITNWLGQKDNGAPGSGITSPTTPGGGTNMFPNAAVPAFAGLQQDGSGSGLSGGSQ